MARVLYYEMHLVEPLLVITIPMVNWHHEILLLVPFSWKVKRVLMAVVVKTYTMPIWTSVIVILNGSRIAFHPFMLI